MQPSRKAAAHAALQRNRDRVQTGPEKQPPLALQAAQAPWLTASLEQSREHCALASANGTASPVQVQSASQHAGTAISVSTANAASPPPPQVSGAMK
jgi:hypothetical protein